MLVSGAAAVASLTGCRVSTRVTVDERSAGRGTIRVAVTLDRSALAALGGLSALSSDLDVTGLAASGWQVTGPSAGPGDGAVVTASHSFSSDAEAAQLASSLAGTGPASSRPFRFTLTNRTTFWHVYSRLSGTVDLTCGLDCFGDSGLKASTGNATGVDPGPLLGGQNPAQIFSFNVQAHLPGGTPKSNAANQSGASGNRSLEWAPQLGRVTILSAETEGWNQGSVVLVSVLAGVALLAMVGLITTWLWRRRRRGPGGAAHARRRRWWPISKPSDPTSGPAPVSQPEGVSGTQPERSSTETVTPPS